MSPQHALATGIVAGILIKEKGEAGTVLDDVQVIVDEYGNYKPVLRITIAGETFLVAVMEE